MTLSLRAAARTITGKKVATLRRQGLVPAVAYGHGTDATFVSIPQKELTAIWHEAGSSQLVDFSVDGNESVKVLIHDVQIHPVTSNILHADLYKVRMTEKLETEIPLKFVGESLAVKDLEGNFITEKDALEIRCLPAHLVPEFEVDISVLKTFDDVITVGDIKVPPTIEVLNDPEETVALVKAPRSEEELEAELAVPIDEAAAIAELEAKTDEEKAAEAAEKEAEKTAEETPAEKPAKEKE